MRFFDLHCDTITECSIHDRPLRENDGHLSVKKATGCLDKWAQVFAIWMPDEYRGDDALKYFDGIYSRFITEMSENSQDIAQCRTGAELTTCLGDGRAAAILAVEGGSALGGSLERLDYIASLGVRLITLTWNAGNELASGCFERKGGGLTEFGKQAIKRMEQLGITVDVSHLSRRSFWELADIAEKPFIASHSTCNTVIEATRTPGDDKYFSLLRNLDDRQITHIIEIGGLIGLNFCNSFLGDGGDDGCEAVYRHLSHMLDLGGENAVAIGSDYDGCTVNGELAGVERIPPVYEYLSTRGLSDSLLDKIFFSNCLDFFSR